MTKHPQWDIAGAKRATAVIAAPNNILTAASRIRPWDGGLNTEDPSDQLDPKKVPYCKDAFWYRGELRKAFGGTQIGVDFPDTVLWSQVWSRLDGSLLPVAITTKDLYYYSPSAGWTKVNGAGAWTNFIVNGLERFVVQFMDDVMYFTSDNNPIRSWNGDPASTHAAVVGGYSARGMTILNHHLILVGTRVGATLEAQTARYTQNGSASFTGTGSGLIDFADREDILANIAKIGAFRALAYKTKSIAEVRSTGDSTSPFEQSEVIPGLGLLAPYSLVEWAGGHLFIGSDEQIYNYSGSQFDPIGRDIASDFFNNLDHTRLNDIVATFDNAFHEYIIMLPDSAGAGRLKQYFAYNVQGKRWRFGEYAGATHISCSGTTITGSASVVPPSRYHVFISTNTKRILRLDKDVAASFDGTPLSFEVHTADFIPPEDGDEITLGEVRIGHVSTAASSLIVDASVDAGSTWNAATTVALAAVSDNVVKYAEPTFDDVTGQQVRVRIRNSTAAQAVRIRSISPVPVSAEQDRNP